MSSHQSEQSRTSPFLGVVDQSPYIFFLLDESGIFRYLSPAWEGYTGHGLEAAVGSPMNDSIHPDDRETNLLNISQLVNLRESQIRSFIRLLHRNGSPLPVNARKFFFPSRRASIGKK